MTTSLDRALIAFSDGRFEDALAEVASGTGATDREAELVRADVRVRRFEIGLPELIELRDRLASDGSARSTTWARTLIAERLLVDGDPTTFDVADAALLDLPDDPVAPLADAYLRARLLRISGGRSLILAVGPDAAAHAGDHDAAVTLLVRFGLAIEAQVSVALNAGLRAVTLGERLDEAADRLDEAQAVLAAQEPSWWSAVIDFVSAALALVMDDRPTARAALDRLGTSGDHGRLGAFPGFGRALLLLRETGPTDEALARMRTATAGMGDDPRLQAAARHVVARDLADVGHADATAFGRAALDLPASGGVDRIEHDLLRARLDLLAGNEPDVADLEAVLTAMAEAGRPVIAAVRARRLTGDLDRIGAAAAASTLRAQWPARTEPTGPGRAAHRRSGVPTSREPSSGGAETPATLAVRVLSPRLELRSGPLRPVLGPVEAALLVLLVVAHPAPLHVEEVSDALWPDGPFRRPRLNKVVHRLRRAIAPAGDVIVRDGDLLHLDDRHALVDLWTYREQIRRGPEARRRALLSPGGLLCHVELPHVEVLIDARHRLEATWLGHVRTLLSDPACQPADAAHLAEVALGLGLDPALLR